MTKRQSQRTQNRPLSSVTYTYDAFDRLEKVVYNDTGNYIEYLYTADGALGELHYKKSNGTVINSYTFEYDSLGRLIRSAEYNASGLVQRTEHLYDEHNRLSSQSWVVGSSPFTESYTYNDPETAEDSGDGSLLQMTTAAGATIDYRYDALKRLDGTTVTPKDASTALYTSTYAYKNNANGNTTNLVAEYRVQGSNIYSSYTYTYDELGNITAIYGQLSATENPRVLAVYTYDSQNQLEQEILYTYSSATSNTSETTRYKYNYDTAGNLLSVEKYDGLTDTTPDTTSYTYGNAQWLDLLTAYDGGKFAYEGQTFTETVSPKGTVLFSVRGTPTSGNPISYYNGTRWEMAWEQGRDLKTATNTTTNSTLVTVNKVDTEIGQTYTYDADGIRTGKTSTTKVYKYRSSTGGGEIMSASVDPNATLTRYLYSSTTVSHSYITQNGKVVRETIGSGTTAKILDFIYDESGKPFALDYTNGAADPVTYYYVLNLQGDVIGLIDAFGEWVAKYAYNAWGEILSVTNANGVAITSSTHIANLNPLRYRGYYYDTETGFYYLQSRYYDPVIHRFINADSYQCTGQGFIGTNMFAYCNNRTIIAADSSGEKIVVVTGGEVDEETILAEIQALTNDQLSISGGSVVIEEENNSGEKSIGTALVREMIESDFTVYIVFSEDPLPFGSVTMGGKTSQFTPFPEFAFICIDLNQAKKNTPIRIILGHELIHAWRMTTPLDQGYWNEELLVTGLFLCANIKYTENMLRKEQGLPLRDRYYDFQDAY